MDAAARPAARASSRTPTARRSRWSSRSSRCTTPRASSTIIVSTYQATSGKGHAAVEELLAQTRAVARGARARGEGLPRARSRSTCSATGRRARPTTPRRSGRWSTRRARSWATPSIGVSPTTVRVPVVNGHSEAVHVQFHRPMTAAEAKGLLRNAPGVVLDGGARTRPGKHPQPALASGTDAVYVGPRARRPGRAGRDRPVRRERQPAQGRRAQRGADRGEAVLGLGSPPARDGQPTPPAPPRLARRGGAGLALVRRDGRRGLRLRGRERLRRCLRLRAASSALERLARRTRPSLGGRRLGRGAPLSGLHGRRGP